MIGDVDPAGGSRSGSRAWIETGPEAPGDPPRNDPGPAASWYPHSIGSIARWAGREVSCDPSSVLGLGHRRNCGRGALRRRDRRGRGTRFDIPWDLRALGRSSPEDGCSAATAACARLGSGAWSVPGRPNRLRGPRAQPRTRWSATPSPRSRRRPPRASPVRFRASSNASSRSTSAGPAGVRGLVCYACRR